MKLSEIKPVIALLEENDFKQIKPSEDYEDLNYYYTVSEIARRIDIRLDSDAINEAIVALGYKTFHNKIGIPTSPENSAFVLKSFEDEITDIKSYYIQCLWSIDELKTINSSIMNNENFEKHKQELINKNEKTRKEKLSKFKKLTDYVVISVKKTGFNTKKDFVVYISYSIFNKDSGLISSGYLLINDDLDSEKTYRYLEKNDITDMSPYDYVRVEIPTMDNCKYQDAFLDRIDALRKLYVITRNNNVVFYSDIDEKFINTMYENEWENIPEVYHFKNTKRSSLYFKDLIDWLEPKESFKLRDIFTRYNVIKQSGLGFSQDAVMLNEAVHKTLCKY